MNINVIKQLVQKVKKRKNYNPEMQYSGYYTVIGDKISKIRATKGKEVSSKHYNQPNTFHTHPTEEADSYPSLQDFYVLLLNGDKIKTDTIIRMYESCVITRIKSLSNEQLEKIADDKDLRNNWMYNSDKLLRAAGFKIQTIDEGYDIYEKDEKDEQYDRLGQLRGVNHENQN